MINNEGIINDSWLREKILKLENYSGGIEELSIKISNIRTWTYISNQTKWIKEYEFWQNKTKEIEDNLSDNLHESLTKRFVDFSVIKDFLIILKAFASVIFLLIFFFI